ncbi:MAG: four helix bundle protein [Nitrospirae bacterium]|nr:four helix bundle protein [Nitrospirota bacterium]
MEKHDAGRVKPHKRLQVWRQSLMLVKAVYESTRSWPEEERYGLTSQARRAAVSIASNIAEGAGRQTRKEFANFLHYAQGSLSELDTHLEIARLLEYRTDTRLEETSVSVSKMLTGLIRSLKRMSASVSSASGLTSGLLLTAYCSLV